ncbi:MAG: methylmalonyl-CoA decarboxylase [Chthoniobacterales bacterium]|nr:methylmalonyl-CoA decarboxylase [Chthoniobacterales bacterium]MCX7712828.1 methylmalonyl-CoA decarboxylase [Chthoniobacterales bacterium]
MQNLILTELKERLGTITLNHPEKRNCLSSAMADAIIDALDSFQKQQVTVVIIRAQSGVKVWSAGYDVHELPYSGRDPLPYKGPLESLIRKVQEYPGAIIAMIQGSVWGGACDLTFSCDILIGDPTASFAMTPAKIGVPYNPSGLIHFINILGINKAKEMFFTGEPINAHDSFNLGILNHLVQPEEIENFTYSLAQKILENSSLAIRAIKRQFCLLNAGTPLTAETFELIQAIRREVYDSEDYREGIQAFLEKRKPQFKGR